AVEVFDGGRFSIEKSVGSKVWWGWEDPFAKRREKQTWWKDLVGLGVERGVVGYWCLKWRPKFFSWVEDIFRDKGGN
ncbi:hypothetical protein A2U01_0045367, partial [Trifolium medium]|nr:hypothetical protein [Trifolium medium]